MAAVLTDTTIAPRSRFVKQTGRFFDGRAVPRPPGLPPSSFVSRPPAGAKRSPASAAGLGCKRRHPINGRTGGSGGHFALGIKAPRRPFCPLSAGGKWTNAPQRFAAGAPLDQTASVAGKTGSLRHDGGTRRRSPLCGQTAQALRSLCARRRGTFPTRRHRGSRFL